MFYVFLALLVRYINLCKSKNILLTEIMAIKREVKKLQGIVTKCLVDSFTLLRRELWVKL